MLSDGYFCQNQVNLKSFYASKPSKAKKCLFFKTTGSDIIALCLITTLKCKFLIIILSGIGLNLGDSWVQRQTVFQESGEMTAYYVYLQQKWTRELQNSRKTTENVSQKVSYVLI